jgi:hypothetical protein
VRLVIWLVIDYFTYVVCPVASAHRTACRVTRRRLLRLAQARRRLLSLRQASMCLGTLRSSSCGSSSTTSTASRVQVPRHVARLVVDYFDYAAHPGASARRAARHPTLRPLFDYAARPGASAFRTARHASRRAARRRLLRLRRASGCLDTLRGSSPSPSSTTSNTPRIRVPRHVVRLVTQLLVDYFDYAARPVATACRAAHYAARRAARRRQLRQRHASQCLGTSCGSSSGSSSTTSPTSCVQLLRHVARLVA